MTRWPLAHLLLGRRLGFGEDVVTLERQLEAVGHARHVVAAAGPPDDVQRARDAEMADQALHVMCSNSVGGFRLLPRERKSRLIAWGEGRPIAGGEVLCVLGN